MKDFKYEDGDGYYVDLFMNYEDKPCVHVSAERYVILSADALRGMRKWLKKALREIEGEQEEAAQGQPVGTPITFTDFAQDDVAFERATDGVWVSINNSVNVKLGTNEVDQLIAWLRVQRKNM